MLNTQPNSSFLPLSKSWFVSNQQKCERLAPLFRINQTLVPVVQEEPMSSTNDHPSIHQTHVQQSQEQLLELTSHAQMRN